MVKKIGETVYAVNALPLGGYVSIWGENGSDEDKAHDGAKNHPRAFGNRPGWAQLLVLVAGVTMNMLLAWLIFVGTSFGHIRISSNDATYGHLVKNASLMIVDAAPDSPAYKAGIIPGSILVDVTSAGVKANLTTATSLTVFVFAHQNDALTISYKSPEGVASKTTIAAVYGIIPDKKAIGISVERVGIITTTPWQALKIGTVQTIDMTALTFGGLKTLVTSAIHGESVIKSLSGPIGIAKIVGQTSTYGIAAVLTLIAILSINLAIFNILPLPALDGGRMVVVMIESVIRKKVPFKYYSWVNILGFGLLMVLLLIVTIHDIRG